MAKYVFAPAGTDIETYTVLKKCIEYIGSKQTGFGSNLSKGRRYLKSKKGCSCTSVKYLYKSVPKTIGHDFEHLGIYVNKYDKNKCAEVLTEIISFIDDIWSAPSPSKLNCLSLIKIPYECPPLPNDAI